MMSEKISFERALKSLEEAVEKLEQGQMPLDEALDCFEAGVRSANICREKLQAVEHRIKVLTKSPEGKLDLSDLNEQNLENS
jgi:exodeoxyribonuclease VII small subunit